MTAGVGRLSDGTNQGHGIDYDPRALTFTRDAVVNGHWVPRGAMVAWVLGAVAVNLAAAWWLTDVARLRLPGLVVLGRTALALYVIHHLIVVNLVALRSPARRWTSSAWRPVESMIVGRRAA